ncbi:MAG: hypothetical protein EHM16_14645 [Betaproteobacteria bacterium]|nr:MAG: hypothetical protein EHM16_14645 [Betaproteobacteria bacterium]
MPESQPGMNPAPGGPPWWRNWKVMVPIWALIVLLVWLGVHLDVDSRVIAGGIFVLGLVSNAFVWMLGIIAMVPVVGPVVAKVLTVGFFWLLNALGYFVSFVAIRRGYSKDVLTYRSLTIALLVGVVIGYVLGKLL